MKSEHMPGPQAPATSSRALYEFSETTRNCHTSALTCPQTTCSKRHTIMLWRWLGLQRLLDELFDAPGWPSFDLPRTDGWAHEDAAAAQD
jgi:hypothetical protein